MKAADLDFNDFKNPVYDVIKIIAFIYWTAQIIGRSLKG